MGEAVKLLSEMVLVLSPISMSSERFAFADEDAFADIVRKFVSSGSVLVKSRRIK